LKRDPEDDPLIEQSIRASVAHYNGWSGILGRCLGDQTWREDFHYFSPEMGLRLAPLLSVVSVTWRNAEGQISTVNDADYTSRTVAGTPFVRFRSGYAFPSDLYESSAVSITYRAGYEEVPDDIKFAIIVRAQVDMDEAGGDGQELVRRIEDGLMSKYRRFSI
jgi:hypothetical protein